MVFLSFLIIVILIMAVSDLYYLFSGLILVRFPALRRLGIRNMVLSVIGAKLAHKY